MADGFLHHKFNSLFFLKKEKTNGDFNPLELLSVGILDSSFLMDLLGSHKDGMSLWFGKTKCCAKWEQNPFTSYFQ